MKTFNFLILLSFQFCFISCSEQSSSTPLKLKRISDDSISITLKNTNLYPQFYFIVKSDKLSYFNNKNVILPQYYDKQDSLVYFDLIEFPNHDFKDLNDTLDIANSSLKKDKSIVETYEIIAKALAPQETINLKIYFNNFDRDEDPIKGGIGIGFDKILREMNVSYNSDSSFVKQNISKELLDSLRINKVRIFHGTINSNRISLKFR